MSNACDTGGHWAGHWSASRCFPMGAVRYDMLRELVRGACFILLMAGIGGEIAEAGKDDCMASITGEGEQTQIVLENGFIRAAIAPHPSIGCIRELIYKPTGRNLSPYDTFAHSDKKKGEGPSTDRYNIGYIWRSATNVTYEVASLTPDQAVVALSYAWDMEMEGKMVRWLIAKRLTLRRGESRMRVDWDDREWERGRAHDCPLDEAHAGGRRAVLCHVPLGTEPVPAQQVLRCHRQLAGQGGVHARRDGKGGDLLCRVRTREDAPTVQLSGWKGDLYAGGDVFHARAAAEGEVEHHVLHGHDAESGQHRIRLP